MVKVTGGAFIPYDYLILCTGQQFQIPVPTDADISTLVTTSEVTMPKVSRYTGPLPSTVFTINTERDCENALNYIRGFTVKGMYVCFEISLNPTYLHKKSTNFAVCNTSNQNFESINKIISCGQFS